MKKILILMIIFLKSKFRTDDNLVYNEIINIPVCGISLSSIIKRKNNCYPNFKLKSCFYESENINNVE